MVPDNVAYAPNAAQGWTGQLQTGPWVAMTNGYLIPGRDATAAMIAVGNYGSAFLTSPTEQYLYCADIWPAVNQAVDRMSPILDDLSVTYMPWDSVVVIEEVELDY